MSPVDVGTDDRGRDEILTGDAGRGGRVKGLRPRPLERGDGWVVHRNMARDGLWRQSSVSKECPKYTARRREWGREPERSQHVSLKRLETREVFLGRHYRNVWLPRTDLD